MKLDHSIAFAIGAFRHAACDIHQESGASAAFDHEKEAS